MNNTQDEKKIIQANREKGIYPIKLRKLIEKLKEIESIYGDMDVEMNSEPFGGLNQNLQAIEIHPKDDLGEKRVVLWDEIDDNESLFYHVQRG